jgi:hypothetical protein
VRRAGTLFSYWCSLQVLQVLLFKRSLDEKWALFGGIKAGNDDIRLQILKKLFGDALDTDRYVKLLKTRLMSDEVKPFFEVRRVSFTRNPHPPPPLLTPFVLSHNGLCFTAP